MQPAIRVGWLVLMTGLALTSWAQENLPGEERTSWRHLHRDVYIDGRLAPDARLYSTAEPSRLALFAEGLEQVLVADLENRILTWRPADDFTPTDSPLILSSTPDPGEPEPGSADESSRIVAIPEVGHLLSTTEHSVLATFHQGPQGELALEELWQSAPHWEALEATYEPEPEAVARLREVDQETELVLALGTWCGDSRRHVPALLRALREADNPHLRLELMAIGRGFTEPASFVRDEQITNVPTLIVRRHGRELGRVVETPASTRIEDDLALLLAGASPQHEGRWSRGERLARGTYQIRKPGVGGGSESWEIFADDEGGRLLHTRQSFQKTRTETWQRLDGEGHTTFAELTHHEDGQVSRTRLWIDGRQLRLLTRSSAAGIVEQTFELPAGAEIRLPGILGGGQAGGPRVFALSPGGHLAAGRLTGLATEEKGIERIETPAGPFRARREVHRHGATRSEWWLHPGLGVPLRASGQEIGEVTLQNLIVLRQPEGPEERAANLG